MKNNKINKGGANAFYGLALTVLIGVILFVGRGVLIPVVIAAFLCFLIFTLKEWVSNTPWIGKYLPTGVSYTLSFLIIGSALGFFFLIIKTNIGNLIEIWPDYQTKLEAIIGKSIVWLRTQDFIPFELVGGFEQIQDTAFGLVSNLISQILGSIRSFSSNIFTLVTVFIYTAFILIERGRIFKKIGLISTDHGLSDAVNETISQIGALIRQYITVKTTTNLITALISYTIMRLVGVDFAGFWALLIFVFNYIPIFGAISAIMLPVTLMLVQPVGGGVQSALILFALMVGAEQFMSSVIEPRLIGKTLNLSPVVILFSLAVWGSLWGFTGFLLSVPITVTVMIVLTQFKTTRPVAIMLSDNGEIAPIRHADLGQVLAASREKNKPKGNITDQKNEEKKNLQANISDKKNDEGSDESSEKTSET